MSGIFARIFEATRGVLDLRAVQVDGSYVKVHQHGTGAPRPSPHGKHWELLQAGVPTKLMALVDRRGRLVRFTLHPGNVAESPTLPALIEGLETREVIADKAYDSDILRRFLAARDITATIPPRRFAGRDLRISYDKASYRTRHLVENLFADLKQFRGLATRYCKLASRFASFVALAGWFIATRHL